MQFPHRAKPPLGIIFDCAMARIDDHTHRAHVEVALAEALRFQGDYAQATTHAIAARDAFDSLGDVCGRWYRC